MKQGLGTAFGRFSSLYTAPLLNLIPASLRPSVPLFQARVNRRLEVCQFRHFENENGRCLRLHGMGLSCSKYLVYMLVQLRLSTKQLRRGCFCMQIQQIRQSLEITAYFKGNRQTFWTINLKDFRWGLSAELRPGLYCESDIQTIR